VSRRGLRFRYRCLQISSLPWARIPNLEAHLYGALGEECPWCFGSATSMALEPHRGHQKGLRSLLITRGNAQLPCMLFASPLQFSGKGRQTGRRLRSCALLLKRNESCVRICDTGFATSRARARLQSSRPVMGWHGSIVGPFATTIVSSTTCGYESLGAL
jgi:hypothetical protein